MKMKYLIFGSIAFYSYFARSQDTSSPPEKIDKTEIEILFHHYLQDGNHSAVTGGTGTEKLTVFSPGLYIKRTAGRNTYALKGGVDVISSASTDNIDYVVSSASKRDARGYEQLDFSRSFSGDKLILGGGAGFSIESDYFSRAIRLNAEYLPSHKMCTYFLNVQMFFDDLRWGRLKEPLKLIYPSELRYKEWFDIYRRNTYAFNSGLTQIIGKRNVIGIFFEFSFQSGLLSTPFHRVYFADNSLAVENLPTSRTRTAFGFKWNSFIGGNVILKNRVDYYSDDFRIRGAGFDHETVIKISPRISMGPHFRFYLQNGSRYFAPYSEHPPDETFFTSDYDLSEFQTYLLGLNAKYSPNGYLGKNLLFNHLTFRYSYFSRTDNLYAHIFSLVLNGRFDISGD
ncbi:MAG: DUF3570 domain-containing protein [Cyclobacteriaceae bacterium]|nr:DUF3570 domain-containing protein [Cyclobacteriaceae bacterium]